MIFRSKISKIVSMVLLAAMFSTFFSEIPVKAETQPIPASTAAVPTIIPAASNAPAGASVLKGKVLKPDGITPFTPSENSNVVIKLYEAFSNNLTEPPLYTANVMDDGSFLLKESLEHSLYCLIAETAGENNPYSDSVAAIVDIKEGQPLTQNLTLTKSFTEKLKEIQNAADGSEIIIEPGDYVLREGITINEKNNLKITGSGKVHLICENRSSNVVSFNRCNNIVLKNVQASHLLMPFRTCEGAVIYTEDCPDTTFENCEFDGCGEVGIRVFEYQRYKENPKFIEDQIQMNIINCYIHNNSESALYFYTQNNLKLNLLIRDSRIINNNNFIRHGKLTDISYEGDNIIKDNSPAGYKRISGKVLKPDGQPLTSVDGGADVTLSYAGYGNQRIENGFVESDGSFNIGSNLPEGDYFLQVSLYENNDLFTDSKPFLVHVTTSRLTEQIIHLTTPAAKGRILKPDGMDFACYGDSYFYISLSDKSGGDYWGYCKTFHDGRYIIGGNIPDGDYVIKVTSEGNQNPYNDSFPEQISLKSGTTIEKNLVFTNPSIKGYVLNPDGTKSMELFGSYATLSRTENNENYSVGYSIGSDGSFHFGGIPDGDYILNVDTHRSGCSYSDPIPLKIHITAGQSVEQNIYLTNPLVKGQILKPDGTDFNCSEDSYTNICLIDKFGQWYEEYTKIKEDGSYILGGNLSNGEYKIKAVSIGEKNPYTNSFPLSISLKAGTTIIKDLRLTTPEVKGYVLNPDGTKFIPSDDSYVYARVTNADNTVYNEECYVQSDGSFKFGGIPDGDYLLMVYSGGENNPYTDAIPLTIHITAGQLTEQNIRLTTHIAKGRILKPDGTNFICSYQSYFDIYLRDKNNHDYSACVQTSDDGSYRIDGSIPEGEYEIKVISMGMQNPFADSFFESISLKAGIVVEKDLKLTTPELKVYILNPDGTRFIPRDKSATELLILNYDILDRVAGNRDIESDGSFRFGGIPDGNYLLIVSVEGENPYCDPEPLKIHITAGQLIEQDMYLTHPLAAGQILKPDGTNFSFSDNSGCGVYLIDKNGDRHNVSVNNDDGSYKLSPHVPDGDYKIRVSSWGTKNPYADSFSESISLKAGTTVKRDLKLTTPEVKGYVLNPDGTKFITDNKFSAYIKIRNADNKGSDLVEYRVENDGSFCVGGIPDGDYLLTAVIWGDNSPYCNPVPLKIHITAGQLIEQNIHLTNLTTATPTTNMNNSTPSQSGGAGQQPVSGSVNTVTPTPTPTIVATSTPKAASTPTPMPKSVIEPSSKIPGADTFSDLKGHWAERGIMQLVENGIVSGYPDNSIKPDAEITRAELTAIIVKAAGLKPVAKPVLKFTDTAQIPDWVKGYLQVAAGKGIISGYSDGSFKAGKQCSRQEMVVMMVRAFGIGESDKVPDCADSEKIPQWARKFVAKAIEMGIVKGYSDNTFKPDKNISRAEAFTILLRCMDKK